MNLENIPPLALINSYTDVVWKQKDFFKSGITLSYNFRKEQLQKLFEVVRKNEHKILEVLHKDLHKSRFEAWTVEIGVIEQELKLAIKNLQKWMRPKKLPTPLIHAIGNSWQYPEPYGNTLVIAPWNYPFMLALRPAVGAIAAGNTVIIKPSEIAGNTSAILSELINRNFDPGFLYVVEADATGTSQLVDNHFNYIFYTGSPRVGKLIYQQAAKNLTPVTLELGGKNPCIVEQSANLKVTASRIVWGKFSNAGQTCVAPDYLLVHASIMDKLIKLIISNIKKFYGIQPIESKDYGRIINRANFERLQAIIKDSKIIYGGKLIEEEKYISPTLVEVTSLDDASMHTEIFGPLLPIIAYQTIDEVVEIIHHHPDPLVCYLFSTSKQIIKKIQSEVPAGDMCINDVIVHFGHSEMPIGGRGNSGIGKYQGKYTFETFSHYKSVLHKSFAFDLSIRYPPFNEQKRERIKKLFYWFFN